MTVTSMGSTVPPVPLPVGLRGQTARTEAPSSQPEPKKVKPQVINSAAADLQRIGLVFNKKLQFVVDHNSNEVIVKVIDKETDKVIKELPPEELQRLHHNLRDTIGFLFDERV
ncbi:MAG: flagellar protein FlaG [Treponema sp.]|nr:flagellar protein FlaG [Treponema sp.]